MLQLQTQNPSAESPVAWETPTRRPLQSVRTVERRKPVAVDPAVLRVGLTPPQLTTLQTMEQFRWFLHFVRRPLFQAPIPVLFNSDASRFVVILEDGTLDEHPTLKLRG